VIAGRFRALRSAVGWAYDERIIDHHPIRNMRGPGRMEPRRPLTDSDLRSVLWTAEANLLAAVANDDGRPRSDQRRRLAEQDLLLSASPPTPAPAAGRSPRSSSPISTAASCASSVPCRPNC